MSTLIFFFSLRYWLILFCINLVSLFEMLQILHSYSFLLIVWSIKNLFMNRYIFCHKVVILSYSFVKHSDINHLYLSDSCLYIQTRPILIPNDWRCTQYTDIGKENNLLNDYHFPWYFLVLFSFIHFFVLFFPISIVRLSATLCMSIGCRFGRPVD